MNISFLKQILSERRATITGVAALVLLNIMLYLYSSIYQTPHLADLRRQVAEKSRLVSGGVNQDAASVYRQGRTDLDAWYKRIPPKKEFARFIGDLFEVAAGNSLKVGGVTYKPVPAKEENLLIFSIAFNVSGKYAAIKSFISDVARMHDIIYIENLSLNSSTPTEESVNMKLQLTAYFRMEGA